MPHSFKAARSVVLGFSLLACSPAAQTGVQSSIRVEPRRYFSLDEFTLVDTAPAEDTAALEEILGRKATKTNTQALEDVITVDPNDETQLVATISVSEAQPEMMYYIDLTSPKPQLRSMGSSFLLHKNGLFLTAYHVFDDYLEDQQEGKSSMMLMYDPRHGFAATAYPLIFSKQYDILLGKVDINQDFPIATTVISPDGKPVFEEVYIYTFNNTDYFIKGLFEAVMRSGTVNSDCTFTQHTLLNDDRSRYAPFISISALVTRAMDGTEIKNDERYAFFAKMIEGNSGAAVFDIVNRQTGVVTTAINSINPKIPNTTVYTGPEKIREMLAVYLSVAGSTQRSLVQE